MPPSSDHSRSPNVLLLGAGILAAFLLPAGTYFLLFSGKGATVPDTPIRMTQAPNIVPKVEKDTVLAAGRETIPEIPAKKTVENPSGKPEVVQPVPEKGPELPPKKTEKSEPVRPVPSAGTPSATFVRIQSLDENELLSNLYGVPEVSLHHQPGAAQILVKAAALPANRHVDLAPMLMSRRPDLAGLPVRLGSACRLDPEPGKNLQDLSRLLRRHLQAAVPMIGSDGIRPVAGNRSAAPNASLLRSRLLDAGERGNWVRPEAIPVLMQMLMAEPKQVRRVLVELLDQIPGGQGSRALANRAIFDLDATVRQDAAQALAKRPPAEFQDQLVPAFQHPWPPVAQHAAELVAYLQLKDLPAKLIPLLENRNPTIAVKVENGGPHQYVVTEMVRINHLKNCLLCHAVSQDRTDLVRGLVPMPGRPLPAPATSPSYYEGNQGDFVRADITYLRQDFSLPMTVPSADPWPREQRFDFLLRRRVLNNLEQTTIIGSIDPKTLTEYPQKEALLFALETVTGQKPGRQTSDWRKLLDTVGGPQRGDAGPEVEELATRLVQTPFAGQDARMRTYAAQDGFQYVRALAAALPRMNEVLHPQGRRLLAERIGKLGANEIRPLLKSRDAELRRAAIKAAGKGRERSLAADLVEQLHEPDPEILWSIRTALLALTGQDFGPDLHADGRARRETQVAWRKWLDR